MGRSYERRTSEHKDGTASAAIIEVEEPTEFEGWGYQVVVERTRSGQSTPAEAPPGIFGEFDATRERLIEYVKTGD